MKNTKDLIMIYKPIDEKIKIYDITYNAKGYPLFLIYLNGQWLRKSAKHFKPVE